MSSFRVVRPCSPRLAAISRSRNPDPSSARHVVNPMPDRPASPASRVSGPSIPNRLAATTAASEPARSFLEVAAGLPEPVEVTAPVEGLIAAPGAVEPEPSAQVKVPVPEPPVAVAV